jgi:hypothetical protein
VASHLSWLPRSHHVKISFGEKYGATMEEVLIMRLTCCCCNSVALRLCCQVTELAKHAHERKLLVYGISFHVRACYPSSPSHIHPISQAMRHAADSHWA